VKPTNETNDWRVGSKPTAARRCGLQGTGRFGCAAQTPALKSQTSDAAVTGVRAPTSAIRPVPGSAAAVAMARPFMPGAAGSDVHRWPSNSHVSIGANADALVVSRPPMSMTREFAGSATIECLWRGPNGPLGSCVVAVDTDQTSETGTLGPPSTGTTPPTYSRRPWVGSFTRLAPERGLKPAGEDVRTHASPSSTHVADWFPPTSIMRRRAGSDRMDPRVGSVCVAAGPPVGRPVRVPATQPSGSDADGAPRFG